MSYHLLTDQYKLERLIKEAGFSRSELARVLQVGYRSVYRWLEEGVKPHPRQARDIDKLFKDHIDLSPWIDWIKKDMPDPIRLLRKKLEVREKLFLLLTYNSNAIEGSRMSIKDTEKAMQGKKVRGKEFFEILEAVNHHNALRYMLEVIKPGFKITEEYVLRIHSLVMHNFHDKLPGKYRTGYVNLTNTEKKLPPAQIVPARMRALVREMNEYRKDYVKKVAQDHYEFESIHPFFDGNGRVGRILLLTELLSHGFPPSILAVEDRYKYYLALTKGDMGDFRNLVQLMCESILKGYDHIFGLGDRK